MPAPAIVMNDRIVGLCPNHLIPAPSGTAPSPPLPFSAPILMDTVPTVLINNKPAAVMGSSGYNMPPHTGIVDPFVAPNLQVGRILTGSPTVLFGGKPAASATSQTLMCATPGTLVPTVTNVMIG